MQTNQNGRGWKAFLPLLLAGMLSACGGGGGGGSSGGGNGTAPVNLTPELGVC